MISKNRIKFIRSLSLKKNRDALGLFVAEGPKIVSDLLSNITPVYIAATNDWLKQNINIIGVLKLEFHNDFAFDEVSDDELKRISLIKTD